MADNPSSPVGEKLEALRRGYAERLAEKAERLDALAAAAQIGKLAEQERMELLTLAHKLTGTGATYGFADISAAARALEERLAADLRAKAETLAALIEALRAACRAGMAEAAPPKESEASAAPENKSLPLLLALDDDEDILRLVRQTLAQDARIITGANTAEGEILMRAYKPDLVLMDDIMPGGLSGLRFLEDLRKDPELAAIPVVMLTASAKQEEVMRGLMSGAVDYVTKPFDPDSLAQKVRERLRRKKKCVLIADDDPDVRSLLSERFSGLQCSVVEAADGDAAWAAALRLAPDLIILDRVMPGLDGMELLRLMRHTPRLEAVPVLFLTAKGSENDAVEGFYEGAADYIPKPFDVEDVIRRAANLLRPKG